jgi:hypothetical protein
VNGASFAQFVGPAPFTGPAATLKSLAPSGAVNDVKIQVDFTGTAGGRGSVSRNFTVQAPQSTRFIRNDDSADPTFTYMTRIHKAPVDQFRTDLPRGIEINEQFTAAPTADFAGMDWRRGPNGGGFIMPPDWFYDMVGGETVGHTPAPVAPGAAGANVKVYHWPGTWRLGSRTIGRGRTIESVTWQKYRGYGRHE